MFWARRQRRQAYLEEGKIMMCSYREIGTNTLLEGWFFTDEKLYYRNTDADIAKGFFNLGSSTCQVREQPEYPKH